MRSRVGVLVPSRFVPRSNQRTFVSIVSTPVYVDLKRGLLFDTVQASVAQGVIGRTKVLRWWGDSEYRRVVGTLDTIAKAAAVRL